MRLLFLWLVFLPINAWSGFPPTTTKGSADANPIVTFEIDAPNIPITHTGTKASIGTIPPPGGGTGQTTYTNGQLLIGNTTGNTLTKSTLTAGTGITITNGTGSITIASSAGASSSQLIVDGYYLSAAGCVWTRSSNTPGALNGGALTSCNAFTAETNGPGSFGVDTTTTGTVPQVAFGTLPAGTYCVYFEFNGAAASGAQVFAGVNDGAVTHGGRTFEAFSSDALAITAHGCFVYATTQTSIVFTLYMATGTSTAWSINQQTSFSGGGPVRVSVIKTN